MFHFREHKVRLLYKNTVIKFFREEFVGGERDTLGVTEKP